MFIITVIIIITITINSIFIIIIIIIIITIFFVIYLISRYGWLIDATVLLAIQTKKN